MSNDREVRCSATPHDRPASWGVRLFPFLRWLPRVNRRTLRADLLAGVIGAIVALPQGVAFAAIAGMPPQYGLYSGMVPAIIAALFGSSWLLVSGPTTAASLVLFSALSEYVEPGTAIYVQMALVITLMVGLIQLAMGMARFGSLVNFISHSVVMGFTLGAAVLIIASQTKHFLGLSYSSDSHIQDILGELVAHLPLTNPATLAVGLGSLLTGIVVRRFRPTWPYMIICMVVGSLLAALLGWLWGKETVHIACIGALPATLPPLSLPTLSLEDIRVMAPIALAMALFALTEAISIARTLADKTGQELDGNQEFIGQGLSNIIGSFFSGYVATGSFNRSGMNYEAGAQTPLAAVCAGILLVPVSFLFAPLAGYLPKATLAAVLYLVAWRLMDLPHVLKVVRKSRTEALILGTTCIATLFLEMHFAILLGILASLVIYLNRTSHPHVLVRVPDPRLDTRAFTTDPYLPECPQLKIIRIDGSLYFGAIPHVRSVIRHLLETAERPEGRAQRNLLIIGSGINFIDMVGAEFLQAFALERKMAGGQLFFYDMKEGVCTGFNPQECVTAIGAENIFVSKKKALAGVVSRLDRRICMRCRKRIFLECQHFPVCEDDGGEVGG